MAAAAAASIRAHHEQLSELDSVAGDGDHGGTMLRVVERLVGSFQPDRTESLNACLREAGWNILAVDGGAASSLIGMFFVGMGDAPEEAGLGSLLEAWLSALRQHSKADPGDKTMMDALVPAVKATRQALDAGGSEAEALRCAAVAARSGAEQTRNMKSRYGRAKFAGERTVGHADPGAVSIALIFEGFSQGMEGP